LGDEGEDGNADLGEDEVDALDAFMNDLQQSEVKEGLAKNVKQSKNERIWEKE
jgi:hypothetical protein